VNPAIILDIIYIDADRYGTDITKEAAMANTETPVLPQTTATTWNIDPAHTVAEFKVKHMMIANVKGHFPKVSGVLVRDESGPANDRVEATIEAASIQTRDDQRDAHLKSADFFHVEKFPTLHFKSTDINVVGAGELSVEGDLTIRGVTRRVRFAVEGPTAPAKDPWGNTRIGVSANTKINRKDFGLTWNAALETGGILVGDDITITLDAQFVKA
jgi:polyisoprenoid-binding protein YceI